MEVKCSTALPDRAADGRRCTTMSWKAALQLMLMEANNKNSYNL